jgi:hypothetical protein
MTWYLGDSETIADDLPRYGDIVRHPVTGSTYLVLSVAPRHGAPGEWWVLQLEGKGLHGKPLGRYRKTVDYATHFTRRYSHRDG